MTEHFTFEIDSCESPLCNALSTLLRAPQFTGDHIMSLMNCFFKTYHEKGFYSKTQEQCLDSFLFVFYFYFQVDKHFRFMILMDGVHPEMDTCIIVEYKGACLIGEYEVIFMMV